MSTALGYLVLAFLAGAIVWCYYRPSFAFVLVMTLYTLKQLQMTYLQVFVTNSTWFNYIVFLAVVVGAGSNLLRSREALRGYWNKFFGTLVFLYIFALFSLLYTPSQQFGMDRARDGGPYWLMQVFLLPLCFSNLNDFRKAVTPTIITGVVIVLMFLANPRAGYVSGRLTLNIGEYLGVADYRGNPLATAQLGGHLALLAALMLPLRAAWFMHAFRVAGVFLGLGIAVAAGSRGQLAIAILVMIAFYPLARQVKDIKQFFLTAIGLGVMSALALISLSFFVGQDRLQANRWDPSTWGENLEGRGFEAWKLMEAWAASPMHWLFGLGVNAFSFISGDAHSYAHNIFIEMLGELGLFGLVIFCVLLTWLFKMSRELFVTYKDDPVGRATVAVLLSQAAYLGLLALKQGTFVSIPEPWYIWVLVAKFATAERLNAAAGVHDLPDLPAADSYTGPEHAAAYGEDPATASRSNATPPIAP